MPEPFVVAVAPPLSLTVALAMVAAVEALVTVPLSAPVVGARMKLTFGVVWPPVTVAVSVWGANWLAEAVRVWLPRAGPGGGGGPGGAGGGGGAPARGDG